LSYLIVAIRNIRKLKGFSLINIAGMGMCLCVLADRALSNGNVIICTQEKQFHLLLEQNL